MQLFLSQHLEGFDLRKGEDQTGESRGGKYAARVQIGIEKDGSPKYRYFDSIEQYKAYLEGSGKKKERQAKQRDDSSDLADKVKDEHDSSKKKQETSAPRKTGNKKKDDLLSTKKSLSLYLGSHR